MKVSSFDYLLPKELIAQGPLAGRGDSRMMALLKNQQRILHSQFRELAQYLTAGDCLVLNDTKVIPARLHGKRAKTGGRVEVLLLEPAARDATHKTKSDSSADERRLTQMADERGGPGPSDSQTRRLADPPTPRPSDGPLWLALTESRGALKPGEEIEIADGALRAQVEGITEDGTRLLRFTCSEEDFPRLLGECGEPPLPPYIKRQPVAQDFERYQTVYAHKEGAVAAPTAGLHFTPAILEALRGRGVAVAALTLHVGLGTFRPVKVEDVEEHQMHSERFELPEECAQAVNETRQAGKKVVAVGTTVVRVLEACADLTEFQVSRQRVSRTTHTRNSKPETRNPKLETRNSLGAGQVQPQAGRTNLFIYPGYRFKVVDALLTNFHLPRSTLLMLVCAFGGTDFVLEAYREAVAARYRFYSYGDCMLVVA